MGHLSNCKCCTTINKEEQKMDKILELLERYAGKVHNWAWDKRWKYRDPNKWIKGYREWKKRRCPHN